MVQVECAAGSWHAVGMQFAKGSPAVLQHPKIALHSPKCRLGNGCPGFPATRQAMLLPDTQCPRGPPALSFPALSYSGTRTWCTPRETTRRLSRGTPTSSWQPATSPGPAAPRGSLWLAQMQQTWWRAATRYAKWLRPALTPSDRHRSAVLLHLPNHTAGSAGAPLCVLHLQVAVKAINTDGSGGDQTATGDLLLSSMAAVGMPSKPEAPTLTVPAKRVLQVM